MNRLVRPPRTVLLALANILRPPLILLALSGALFAVACLFGLLAAQTGWPSTP